jgi:hypothetical protein
VLNTHNDKSTSEEVFLNWDRLGRFRHKGHGKPVRNNWCKVISYDKYRNIIYTMATSPSASL